MSTCPKCGKPIRSVRHMTVQGLEGVKCAGPPPRGDIGAYMRSMSEVAGKVSGGGLPPGLQGTKYGIPGDPSTWTDQPHVSTNTLTIPKPWVADPKYLKHRLTLDDLRREQGKRDEVFDLKIAEFVLLYKPGDEVWWWDDMYDLAGSAGYALVRNGYVIAMLTVMVS